MVARVPAYSPEAVAEHTVTLMLSLNRKIYRARDRVREGNFALDGLIGRNLHGRVAGVIGQGRGQRRVDETDVRAADPGHDLGPHQRAVGEHPKGPSAAHLAWLRPG